MTNLPTVEIWIDGDACPKPIKEIIFRAAIKNKTKVRLVANSHVAVPRVTFIEFVQVGKGDDVADQYIADNLKQNDLVVTGDIPLAARVVELGAFAINPRGEVYTKDNVGERLSMREFAHNLRLNGTDTGGPKAHTAKHNQQFANSLNRMLHKLR